MNTIFYRFPRLSALVIVLVVLAGLNALFALSRQEDPTLTERFGNIVTLFPGASAERVEALVTDPIERRLLELPELQRVESRTRNGVSQVNVEIRETLLGPEVEEAWTLIRQQVEQARADLPAGAEPPDVERVFVGAATMIVALRWDGAGEPPIAILGRLGRDLEQRFQAFPGTDQTRLFGEPEEEIQVRIDPERLAAAGLTAQSAAAIVASSDTKAPAGRIRSETTALAAEIAGEFDTIGRIREAPLAGGPNGEVLRVGDIATVVKSEITPQRTFAIGAKGRQVVVAAFIEPGLQADKWAKDARALVENFAQTTPRGVEVAVIFDQSKYTTERLFGLAVNLAQAAAAVFAVVLVAMGWRAAFVVGSSLPLTVLLVLILFAMTGKPLHQMSVTGLIIALGLLIDNAIIVVDEYNQRRRAGMGCLEAIDKTVGLMAMPLFASSVTTMLAFAPIALMPGGAGEFIGMIGLSVIYAIGASFLVALTVVPALAAWTDPGQRDASRPLRWWRDGFYWAPLAQAYRWTVDQSVRRPWVGLLVGLAGPIAGFVLIAQQPLQFFPPTDRDMFQLDMTLGPEASIGDTIAAAERARRLLLERDGVVDVNWFVGEGAPRVYYNAFNIQNGVPNFAAGFVRTTDPTTTRAILPQIQADMIRQFPQAQFLTLPYEQGPPFDAPIAFRIVGPDLRTLKELGDATRGVLSQVPGVTFTFANLQTGLPKAEIAVDEIAARAAGISPTDIADRLRAALDGAGAGAVLEGVENIPVRVIAEDDRRQDLAGLSTLAVGGAPGQIGPTLGALGAITLEPAIGIIQRYDGERMNQIYGFLEPYTLPAPANAAFQTALAKSDFALPPGYRLVVEGEAGERDEAVGNLFGTAGPLVVLMIGAVMLAFNSARLAGIVFTVGFLSLGLAMLSIWAFNLPFGFNGIVGSMGLLGLSINGAIIVLTGLKEDPGARAGDVAAQREVVITATRHILSTTATTVVGFVPIILSADRFWLPLATSIAGGVLGSAVLALYFTPAAYRLVRRKTANERVASAAFNGLPAPAE